MNKEDHIRKYMQAVARQQYDKQPSTIELIECLPDCYRYTRRDGQKILLAMSHGKKFHPIVLCGR